MTSLPSYYKKVISANVVFGGSGYTSAPTVQFVGGKSGTSNSAFSTASGIAIIENGKVVAIEITNEGFDYVSTPEITFTGGGGTGASATANLSPIDSIYGDFAGSLAHLIQHQLPLYVRKEYPQFVLFLEKYYEFLEQQGQANNILLNLESFSDIHRTLDMFLPSFKSQYLRHFPKNTSVDERLLIKFIREFYEAKGSPKSIEFLFRLLFDEHVEIYYPSENILRASDGIWVRDNVIRITPNDSQDVFSLKGKIVDVVYHTTIGSITTEHKVEIIVLSVKKIAYTSPAIYELTVNLDLSSIPVLGAAATATAYLTENYELDTIEVGDSGIGYSAAPTIVINSYTGSGAAARAYITETGNIDYITVLDGGQKYGGTKAGGVVYYFDTNSESDITYPQVAEQSFRFNSDDPSSVTEIYVNKNSAYQDSSSWLQDISDEIIANSNTGYFTIFSNDKEYFFKIVDVPVDNTVLYDYWKFIVEYQWGSSGNFVFSESCSIAFSSTVVSPAVEFDTTAITTQIRSKDNAIVYGNLLRILTGVSIVGSELAPAKTEYGFRKNTIYEVFESGSTGEYAFAGYFAEDYVLAGINNRASVKIIDVDADGLPTKIDIAFSGYGFQRETFTTTITSSNGSTVDIVCYTGSQYTATGRYKDSRGFLSDANKLQDNVYYQNYSYVIRSGVSARNWMEIIKNTVHPAGMAVFGELIINENVNYGIHITPIEEKLHLYEFPMDVVSTQTFIFDIDFIKIVFDSVSQKEFDRTTDYLVSVNKPFSDSISNYDTQITSVGKGASDSVSTTADLNRDVDIIVDYIRNPNEYVSFGEGLLFDISRSLVDTSTQKPFDRDTDYIVNFTKLITYQDDLELVGDYSFDETGSYFAEDYVETPGINQILANTVDSIEVLTSKGVYDNTSTSDVINNFVISKTITDNVTTVDIVDSIAPVFMIPNDDPIVVDVATSAVYKSVSDAVNTTDSTILGANKNIVESIPYGVNEDISVIEPGKGAQSTLHTMEHIYNDTTKNTSDIATASDSGIINIQDYWSESYSSGAYVGTEYTF